MKFDSDSAKQAGQKSSRKGVPNKDTSERDWIETFIRNDRQRSIEDWEQLTPGERWKVRCKLREFTTAKMRSVETDIHFDNLSDEQLEHLYQRLANGSQPEN